MHRPKRMADATHAPAPSALMGAHGLTNMPTPTHPGTGEHTYLRAGKMEQIIKHGQSELKYFLFTHIEFDIKFNGDKVRRGGGWDMLPCALASSR
jgi:hypothetical protein